MNLGVITVYMVLKALRVESPRRVSEGREDVRGVRSNALQCTEVKMKRRNQQSRQSRSGQWGRNMVS